MTTVHATSLASTGHDHGSRTSRAFACAAFFAAGGFLAVLALLHVVEDDLDPSWRVVSEYGIGRHGWLMSLAFVLFGVACAAVAVGLREHVVTRGGRLGLALLGVAAAGTVVAAFATSDPITATSDELTTHGRWHGVGALLGIPSVPIAAALVTSSLARNPAWATSRRALWRASALTWTSIVVFAGSMVLMYDGEYGPDVRIGWPNRFVIVSYCVWLMTAAAAAAARGSRYEHERGRA